MCCLALTAGFLGPRIALFLWWIFGDKVDLAFDTWIWPLLGLIFLPWTTLAYVLAWGPHRCRERPGLARRRTRLRRRHRDLQRSRREVAVPDDHVPVGARYISPRRGGNDPRQRTSSSAAASISSSETSTSVAASPSGTNESLLATRASRPS